MNVLVTGARGFLGRNLIAHLRTRPGCTVLPFDTGDPAGELRAGLETAAIVYHLAGVNRPERVEEFESGNAGFTREICDILSELGRAPAIVMSSTIQAAQDNPYGNSKRRAEEALCGFAARTGARVRIFRLKNVFGKWCRPNYNSVVATFCHNIARGEPVWVSDPDREVELVYVDDVVGAFIAEGEATGAPGGCFVEDTLPSYRIRLADLKAAIESFHAMRETLRAPDFSGRFQRRLYATYLSYVNDEARARRLGVRADARGALAEFLKSPHGGQVFVSRTRPGVTRGHHYHHTKAEQFLVVAGSGVIRMRPIEGGRVVEYKVRGEDFTVVDIPPGYTHSIENTGTDDLITLFWASEIFDPEQPDTYPLEV